jgi:dTDP-4-dehydrorhamnose 3,5-epimerase-like enzyme
MDNKTYADLVNAQKYPKEPLVPLDAPFVNQNGGIQNLLLSGFTSAAIIESSPGALRANHYHKTDWHYTYVIDGSVQYYWRGAPDELDEKEKNYALFRKGEVFFTPPMVSHAMFFAEKTRILTLARNVRDHEHHEADLVRIEIVKKSGSALEGWTVSWADY